VASTSTSPTAPTPSERGGAARHGGARSDGDGLTAASRPGGRARSSPSAAQSGRSQAAGAALLGLCAVYVALAALPAAPGSRLVPATAGGSPDWLLGPLRLLGLEGATGPLAGPLFYAGLWLALAGYAVVAWRVRELPARAVIAAVIGLHAVFLLAPPLLSQDAFSYIAYARLGVVHGLDPYAASPLAIASDPVFPFAGSKAASSVYGPAFTLLTYPLAVMSVPAALWVSKAVAAMSSLAAVALVWRAAMRRGADPRRAAVLVGLNPALLVHVVGGAHNEALVMLAFAATLVALAGGRVASATGIATAATAVKASAGAVLPFLVAGAHRSRRALGAGAVLAVALAITALALAGFGAQALDWIDAAWANQVRSSSLSLPRKTAEALAAVLPGDPVDFRVGIRVAYGVAFATATAWLLVRTWRGGDPVVTAGWATVALLLCSAWLVPWYLAWLLPLAAIGATRGLAVATVALTAWVLAIAIPF
jgi:alpha-1,6-mannosyltransferase